MLQEETVILGIDFGLSSLGLAISTSGQIASPLGVINIKDKSLNETVGSIYQQVKGKKIITLVVGVSEGTMAQKTKDWAKSLANVLQLPVNFVDESLSSIEAGNVKNNHAKAAAIILQRYLDNYYQETS